MKNARVWLLVSAILASAASAPGQSLEPGLYSNASTGLNFLLGGFVYSEGNAIADPSLDLENGEIEFHSPFLAYARYHARTNDEGRVGIRISKNVEEKEDV
jgi:hypothetical protein